MPASGVSHLGPDIFGADIVFEETTSYSVPFVDDDWSQELRFDESNKWWQKMLEITDACEEDSKGEYLVGVTDLHPGADGLMSIRGPQELCYDVFDQPEVFEKCQTVLLPAFQKQFESLYNRAQKYQKGTSNWMGLYKDTPWYVTSAYFICMLSAEDFEALVLPEIKAELDYLKGASMFHLDGPQALRHLDRLLELPNLHGIQWVYGAGQPSANHWLPVLKKTQAAGNAVEVILQPEDIDVIFKELDPRGLLCHFDWDMAEDEAGEVYERIMKFYR